MSFNVNLLVTWSAVKTAAGLAKWLRTPVFLDRGRQLPVLIRIARISELSFVAVRWVVPACLCVRRNASYVYEIYYYAIGSGSQKVCRPKLN
jgi:hypothetical protein